MAHITRNSCKQKSDDGIVDWQDQWVKNILGKGGIQVKGNFGNKPSKACAQLKISGNKNKVRIDCPNNPEFWCEFDIPESWIKVKFRPTMQELKKTKSAPEMIDKQIRRLLLKNKK